ncbi:MAG: TIGR00730 family Rossman fold protein [Candidatus Liptonbacteria bacterium]|nr:TIGR00730 family Rossman fold protein [Candidatus Liptonbacteria bacterium]
MGSARRICVFCASASSTPSEYITLAEQFGSELVAQGFDLVWGGCKSAAMGALAQGVRARGGRAVGIIPGYMREEGLAYEEADELIVVSNLLERKLRMKELSHAFVALPGGIGTLDELIAQLADAVVDSRRGVVPAKIAILNWEGFYANLEQLLEGLYARGLAHGSYRTLYRILPTIENVFSYLKQ